MTKNPDLAIFAPCKFSSKVEITVPEKLNDLERIISKNPTSSLFARLADAYLQSGDVDRAIEVCEQGLRYRPSYVSGHVVLGKSRFSAREFVEARRAFNKVLHLDPQHAVAIWYLGRIDREMGWDDLALRNFQKAQDLDPLSKSLQMSIDEILTSISNRMGERIRDGVEGGEFDDVPAVDRLESQCATEIQTAGTEGGGVRGTGDPHLLPDRGIEDTPEPDRGRPESGASDGETANPKRDSKPEDPAKDSASEYSPIHTATLAEIFASQGHTARAIAILERVVETEPGNARVRDRINTLKQGKSGLRHIEK